MLEYFDLLGYKVKDKVTNFEGIATSWSVDLYGCIQLTVHAGIDKTGKMQDQCWFDAKRLVKTSKTRVLPLPDIFQEEGKEHGGDVKPMQKN